VLNYEQLVHGWPDHEEVQYEAQIEDGAIRNPYPGSRLICGKARRVWAELVPAGNG
jgi:hypothetical protein